jgi:hypothetical protein
MGLFQYAGVRGRKAMVILISDGEDTTSTYGYDEVKDFAMRAGVTIYAIGIDLPTGKVRTRHQLRNCPRSREAGRSSSPRARGSTGSTRRSTASFGPSTFWPTPRRPPEPSDELREIEVEVDRKGLEVRTISGYFPGGF